MHWSFGTVPGAVDACLLWAVVASDAHVHNLFSLLLPNRRASLVLELAPSFSSNKDDHYFVSRTVFK